MEELTSPPARQESSRLTTSDQPAHRATTLQPDSVARGIVLPRLQSLERSMARICAADAAHKRTMAGHDDIRRRIVPEILEERPDRKIPAQREGRRLPTEQRSRATRARAKRRAIHAKRHGSNGSRQIVGSLETRTRKQPGP